MVDEHNKKFEKGEVSWNMKINQFGDLNDDEFKTKYLSYKTPKLEFTSTFKEPTDVGADPVDWRNKGAVLPVQDQGLCVAGWAFSAVSATVVLISLKAIDC